MIIKTSQDEYSFPRNWNYDTLTEFETRLWYVTVGKIYQTFNPKIPEQKKLRTDFKDIIDQLRAEGTAVVLSTHDLSCVSGRCDKAACLNRRLIAYGSPSEILNEEVLSKTFGTHLLLVHLDGQAYAYQHHSHDEPSDGHPAER